ncbi:MAG TPA: argininosuccinate lyase [Thermoanaerobaculia bacterium]|jgi:argininosuccinate lyase|nr:argininosuccinate lyase [Thermoanaerobaculia bacterium]
MSLLAVPPRRRLFELLYEPSFAGEEIHVLPRLLQIDAAHIVMLAGTGLLPGPVAAALLRVNRELATQTAEGQRPLRPPPSHRGLYLLYEQFYIERLGADVGGAAHLGRSRNDINATVARLRLRDELIDTLAAGLALEAELCAVAQRHTKTVMSAFTHLQPAQPATLGHYLAGIGAELLRALERLAATWDEVNRSPMGAGAGLGTHLPLDRALVADLLGFEGLVDNSLDAVASRDYAIAVLAALAAFAVTLTRLSFDLQLWGSHAYGFLSWPDDLVSTSSMMPQKRNAFVLEAVRGQAGGVLGALTAVCTGLKSAPFANSVEVSSEATAQLWPALAATRKGTELATLMLAGLEVDCVRMREFLRSAQTTMTALADHLAVRHGLPFRTAHEAVARLARHQGGAEPGAEDVARHLEEILLEVTGRQIEMSSREIARLLEPEACAHAAAYGGGPAPLAVTNQIRKLDLRRQSLEEQTLLCERRRATADDRLAEAVDSILVGWLLV